MTHLLKRLAFGAILTGAAMAPAAAQTVDSAAGHAVGVDFHYSSDADETEVARLGVNLDLRYEGPEEYTGITLEKAWFNPSGRGWQGDERVYLRLADDLENWKWNARVGTDGRTVLGSATIHNEKRYRQEYFLEREIVETPQGLARGLYYTFGGGAFDVPIDERNQFTFVGGLQEFTGDNVRTHLRGNFIHVAKPDWGLSLQLRSRYFRNSDPGEFDYYSPRWYAEVLPVVQLRRFSGGFRFLAAAGLGVQRDSETDWRQSRFAHARFTSPPVRDGWMVNGGFTYTNTPGVRGFGYSYVSFSLGVTRAF